MIIHSNFVDKCVKFPKISVPRYPSGHNSNNTQKCKKSPGFQNMAFLTRSENEVFVALNIGILVFKTCKEPLLAINVVGEEFLE